MVIEWFTLNNHQSCHCKILRAVQKWSGDWLVHLFYREISLNVFMIVFVFYTKDSTCPSLVLTCLLHNEWMRAYKIGVHVNMKSKFIQFTSISISWCHLYYSITTKRKAKQANKTKAEEMKAKQKQRKGKTTKKLMKAK